MANRNLPAINLRVRSHHTLFESSLAPKKIVAFAEKHDQPAAGLIDRSTLAGALTFAEAARKADIQPIVGCDFDLVELGPVALIAETRTGWANLLQLCKIAGYDNEDVLRLDDIARHADGLFLLSGAPDSAVARAAERSEGDALALCLRFAQIMDNRFALEVARTTGPRPRHEAMLDALSRRLHIPLVGTAPAAMPKNGYETLEVMAAIRDKRNVDSPDLDRPATGLHLKTPDELEALFADAPHLLDNAARLALRVAMDAAPASAKPRLPRFPDAQGDEEGLLRVKAKEGMVERLEFVERRQHKAYWDRFDTEIDIIIRQGFAGYFLIVADFIGWGKAHDIPIGPGRGSGAGSIIAWALGITELDPLRWGLLFERFINPDRVSLPDFDIDFCETRRGEVIEYVREKYGAERVVAIGTAGTWKGKGAFRDAARALGVSMGLVNSVINDLPNEEPGNPSKNILDVDIFPDEVKAKFKRDETLMRVLKLANELQGHIRLTSTHAAGIVISDVPAHEVVPIGRDPTDPRTAVTQYDMKGVENAGLVKFDFLGLKTLSVIRAAEKHCETLGTPCQAVAIPFEDEETFRLLNTGATTGIFQLESPGMVKALRQVKPNAFEDITALVSLYRPGPMDNIPTYARCKHGHEPVKVPHPALSKMLAETYGIMVYQEQVMKAAQILAGYSLGQADLLRRAMGKKIPAEMAAQREKFVEGCVAQNLPNLDAARASEIFDIIDKFAGYGFNKSHGAAYALVSWQTAYLKTHHPAAFYAASMSYDWHDHDKVKALANDARDRKIELLPPDIARSRVDFYPETARSVRWGLNAIKGFSTALAHVVEAVCFGREYASLYEIARALAGAKAPINSIQIKALANAGCFDRFEKNRALAAEYFSQLWKFETSDDKGTNFLFALDPPPPPNVPAPPAEVRRDAEIACLGLSFEEHPLQRYKRHARRLGAADLRFLGQYHDCGALSVLACVDSVEKKGPKTRIVRLSDATGEMEFTATDTPEIGDIVVAEVVMKSGQKPRLLSWRPFVEEDTPRRLRVTVEPTYEWESLRTILTKPGRGRDRVDILVDAGEYKFRRAVPACFTVEDDTITTLSNAPGVIHVLEY